MLSRFPYNLHEKVCRDRACVGTVGIKKDFRVFRDRFESTVLALLAAGFAGMKLPGNCSMKGSFSLANGEVIF